jgi:3-mercaptopyruvate sulfurtransferase SseA
VVDYANPGVLVDTAWLSNHLDYPSIRIVEVDEDSTACEKGHIPNLPQESAMVPSHLRRVQQVDVGHEDIASHEDIAIRVSV